MQWAMLVRHCKRLDCFTDCICHSHTVRKWTMNNPHFFPFSVECESGNWTHCHRTRWKILQTDNIQTGRCGQPYSGGPHWKRPFVCQCGYFSDIWAPSWVLCDSGKFFYFLKSVPKCLGEITWCENSVTFFQIKAQRMKLFLCCFQVLIPTTMVVAISWIVFWIDIPLEDQVSCSLGLHKWRQTLKSGIVCILENLFLRLNSEAMRFYCWFHWCSEMFFPTGVPGSCFATDLSDLDIILSIWFAKGVLLQLCNMKMNSSLLFLTNKKLLKLFWLFLIVSKGFPYLHHFAWKLM